MKKSLLLLLVAGSLASAPAWAAVSPYAGAVQEVVMKYLPEHYGFAKPKVKDVVINEKSKTVKVTLSESGTYIPLTVDGVKQLKSDIAAVLPSKYQGYKIKVEAEGQDFDKIALFADKPYVAPSEKDRFITPIDGVSAPKGLDGSNIAMWQSHGLYYKGQDEWGWQRPRLWQTCEDLHTQSYVVPFLMPMLQNAGAYVMSPRERDPRPEEYIVDNDDSQAQYSESIGSHAWADTRKAGFAYDGTELHERQNPFTQGTARMAETVSDTDKASHASWNAEIERPGEYAVYVSYQSLPNSATDAEYTVNAANGPHKFSVNQQMGGGTWIYLGHFPLKAGISEDPIVVLSNVSDKHGSVVTADAVKIGGGMGNVARRPTQEDPDGLQYDYKVSGYPRFTEGARYWLQWAGAPDSVYSPTEYTIEYNDDYRSRGNWVNWLTGGSSVLPKSQGLGIPLDLSLAFHTDAGITRNDSIIGTLGIYCTDNQETYPNGTSRWAARDLTDLVLTNVVRDVRASYEPDWTRRGMWNSSYAEARVPQVPAMLLEFLSHQNFADMRYGNDPGFRFAVSRGIYKAMLQFIAHRDGRDYVVQPLPVQTFAITGGEKGKYRLTWAERVDSLEPTATPTYYIVEHRSEEGFGFTPIARVSKPEYEITVNDNEIHSYRIVAGNDGGVSFPSEVLALRYKPGEKQVLIVNAFTRVSGPDWFDYGSVRGFADYSDAGVPYIQDISYVGSQWEFRRDTPWMSNEVAGLGASRADFEDKVLGGNTFDFVAVHGASIAAAGYGFISMSADAFVHDTTSPLPHIVDLLMGNQKEIQIGSGKYGTRFKTFDAPMQTRLKQYTAAGGSVLVTGSYIATDLWNNPFSSESVTKADQAFAKDVLGYAWYAGDATEGSEMMGVKNRYGVMEGLEVEFLNYLNRDMYAVMSPGAITPADKDKGAVVLKYAQGLMPAGTAYVGKTHRAVAIGVPFESIIDADTRNAVMRSALDFLK